MINVWILGNSFANWEKLENYYQYFTLVQEFKRHNCNVKIINIANLIIRNNSKYLEYENELLEAPDIAVFKTYLTGDFWKEKMRKLQSLGTFIINNPDNMIEYNDKISMYQKLKDSNIPIPKTIGLDIKTPIDDIIKNIEETIGWPCIIKPNYGWAAGGLFTCVNPNELKYAIANMQLSMDTFMGKARPKPTSFVIQELVDAKYMLVFTSAGRDKFYTTMVYGKSSHLQKTTYKNSSLLNVFEKYGMTIQQKPSNEATNIFVSALDALGLDIVRAEIFVTDDGYKVCELNGSGSFGIPAIACRENIAKDIVNHMLLRYKNR